jgi:hypothetical protein
MQSKIYFSFAEAHPILNKRSEDKDSHFSLLVEMASVRKITEFPCARSSPFGKKY